MSDQNTDDSHNYSETIGTRLTPQTKRKFDQYCEANEIGKTEALRRLTKEGLDDTDETLNQVNLAAIVAGSAYLAAYGFGGIEAAAAVGGAFLSVLLLWSGFPRIRRALNQ